MEILWRTGILAAIAVTAICLAITGKMLGVLPFTAAAEPDIVARPASAALSDTTGTISPPETPLPSEEKASIPDPKKDQARLEREDVAIRDFADQPTSPDPAAPKPDLKYLPYYVYSELPPEKKPADILLDSLKGVPMGTPIEECGNRSVR